MNTQNSDKRFVTFGNDHLKNYLIPSMKVMLLITDRPSLMSDKELDIGSRFAFEYDICEAKRMTERWGMKLYTKEELLKFKM